MAEPLSARRARALGRPSKRQPTDRLVEFNGSTYEVHEVRGGGHKIFRLFLELVPSDSTEAAAVLGAMEANHG